MTAAFAAALATGMSFVGRFDGSLRTDLKGAAALRVGYTHFFTPVEYEDAPVPVLELRERVGELGGALEIGPNDNVSLGVGGTYFWEEFGAWGDLRVGSENYVGVNVGGLIFLLDELLVTASFELHAQGEDAHGFLRFGAKYFLFVDESTLFIEGELGPVFEPGGYARFDLSAAARYFFTNQFGVGLRFSTYGDDPLFLGEPYFVFLGEYYLDSGLGFKVGIGGGGGGGDKTRTLLELGAAYRF